MITISSLKRLALRCWCSRQIATALCLALVSGAVGTQSGAAKSFFDLPGGYIVDKWNVEDGIPGTQILSIAQSSDGHIWLGTYYGLARFDGQKFVVFDPINHDLPRGAIFHITFGPKGRMWLSQGKELVSYQSGKFTRYPDLLSDPNASTLQLHLVTADGRVLYSDTQRAAKRQQVLLFNSEDSTKTELSGITQNQVFSEFSAARSSDQTVWWAYGNRLGILKGEQVTIRHRFNEGSRVSICSDNKGMEDIWLLVDGEVMRHDRHRLITNEIPNDVHQILSGGENSLWIQRRRNRYEKFSKDIDNRYARTRAFTIPGGKSIIDSEGTFWLAGGIGSQGLSRVRQRKFHNLSTAGTMIRRVLSIAETEQQELLLGSSTGLYRIPFEQTFSDTPLQPEKIQPGNIWALAIDREEEIFGGIYQNNLKATNHLNQPKTFKLTRNTVEPIHGFGRRSGRRIVALCHDHQNRTWIGSSDAGLACVNQEQVIQFDNYENQPGTRILSLACDLSGAVWIGTENEGIFRFQNDRFEHLSREKALSATNIRAIHVGLSGIVWFGTGGHGIYRYQDGVFNNFTTAHGLPVNEISTLIEDGLGYLWFGSYNGIHRVSLDSMDRVSQGQTKHLFANSFSLEDGLTTLQCTSGHPASFRSRDGRLWFGNVAGINYIDPNSLPVNETPPNVHLTEIHLDGQVYDLSQVEENETFTIPAQTSRVEIHFTGINFTAPNEVRFRYQLGGAGTVWNELGTQRSVVFLDLAQGPLEFRVTAANQGDVWNEEGVSLKLQVEGPIWQTTWFRSLSAVLAIALLVGSLYLRFQRLKQKQALKERFTREILKAQESDRMRIARELHDSLEQNLLVVKNRASFTLQSNPSQEKMATALTEISEISSESIHEVRQIANDLRPYQIDRLGLSKAMQSMLNQIASSTDLTIEHEIEPMPEGLSQELKINLYRILQEALNNILKHADANLVTVSLVANERTLSLRIKDNGIGFDFEKEQHNKNQGFGIGGIRERVAILKGACSLKSSPGFGTEWTIRVHHAQS